MQAKLTIVTTTKYAIDNKFLDDTRRRRRRRPKVVPRAAADFVRQLKNDSPSVLSTRAPFDSPDLF